MPPPPTATAAGTPAGTEVLKEEAWTRIELLDGADGVRVFRKIYRTPWRLAWRSFLRPSRARREFRSLRAACRAGLPCVEPLSYRETRRFGCVTQSEISSVFAPGRSLKSVMQARELTGRQVHHTMRQLGELVRRFHEQGFLWLTAVPRNVILCDPPSADPLLACDMPYGHDLGDSICGRGYAALDLFPMAFSAARMREFRKVERRALVLAYCRGDRAACRDLWRTLTARTARRQKAQMGLFRGGLGALLSASHRLRSACPRPLQRLFWGRATKERIA